MILAISLACFALSLWATGFYRRQALRRALLDIPNDRSSHALPTPRGGGIAIWGCFWLGVFLFNDWQPGWVLFLLASIIVAGVSFYDDLGHVPARWRLLAQAVAAGLVIWGASLQGLLVAVPMPWLAAALLLLGLMWLVNLYNFMDGINGIAALTAVCVAGSLAGLLFWQSAAVALWCLPLLLALTSAGFLWWNFPRAAIFMGDIGSCFIGLALGFMVLLASAWKGLFFVAGLILLAGFITDASVTLCRRAWRRQRLYQAHREHAYQHLSRRWQSHTPVTVLYAAITLLWLLPLAAAVVSAALSAWLGLLLAYLPLLLGAVYGGAGRAERAVL